MDAFEEYKSIFLAYRNFADRTRVEYMNDIADLIQFLEKSGLKDVKSIGLPVLERYLADLDRRGLASSTRKRKVVSIRSFLWYLYQDQYLLTNLAKRLIPPLVEAKTPHYLTKLECDLLLSASIGNKRDHALIQLLLHTGITLSELVRLTRRDIEILNESGNRNGYLQISSGRSKKGRIIPLNAEVCKVLDRYLMNQNKNLDDALFANRFGKPITPRGGEKIMSKYARIAGVKKANIRNFRHTFAMQLLISGADIKTIQDLMGLVDYRSVSNYFNLHTKSIISNMTMNQRT